MNNRPIGDSVTSIRGLFYNPSRNIGHIVTVPEVAEVMKLSESSIRDLVNDGKIPAMRVGGAGGRIRMLTDNVISYFEGTMTNVDDESGVEA